MKTHLVIIRWGTALLLAGVFGGCGKKSVPDTSASTAGANSAPSREIEEEDVPEKYPVANETKLRAILLPQPQANAYQTRLEWKGAAKAWWIRRQEGEGERQLVAKEISETHWRDVTVAVGKEYTYYLSPYPNPETEPIAEVRILIPRDLEIKGGVTLAKITGINRLFFADGACLFAAPEGLTIAVKEIHAGNGMIASFPLGQTAPPMRQGRSAAPITLRAITGTGKLTIHAVGENGGPGIAGKVGSAGLPGNPGNSVSANFQALIALSQAPPGQSSVNGGSGTTGGNGGPGSDGSNGGDSSRVYVSITNPSAIQIALRDEPGLGGIAGHGGSGGIGGPGGPQGADPNHVRPDAVPGQKGADGVKGVDGKPGLPGKRQPVCRKLGSALDGECEQFINEE